MIAFVQVRSAVRLTRAAARAARESARPLIERTAAIDAVGGVRRRTFDGARDGRGRGGATARASDTTRSSDARRRSLRYPRRWTRGLLLDASAGGRRLRRRPRRRDPPCRARPVRRATLPALAASSRVATRLGRALTFVDLTCRRPWARSSARRPRREIRRRSVFLWRSARHAGAPWDARVKPGATVSLRATHTRTLTTPPRPRDAEAQKLRLARASPSRKTAPRWSRRERGGAAKRRAVLEAKKAPSNATLRSASDPLSSVITEKAPPLLLPLLVCAGLRGARRVRRPRCGGGTRSRPPPAQAIGARQRGRQPPRAAAVARERDEDPHGDESRAGKQHSDRLFAAWLVETFALVPAALDDGSNGGGARAAGDEPRGTENLVTKHEDANDSAPNSTRRRPRPRVIARLAEETVRRARVADIAGGGGTLSFELHVRHGCECVPVDPRPWRRRGARDVAQPPQARRGAAARRRVARVAPPSAGCRSPRGRARGDAHVRRVLVNTDAARRDPGHPAPGGRLFGGRLFGGRLGGSVRALRVGVLGRSGR